MSRPGRVHHPVLRGPPAGITIVQQDNGDEIATAAVRTTAIVVDGGLISAAQIDHSVFQTKPWTKSAFQRELQIFDDSQPGPWPAVRPPSPAPRLSKDGVVTFDRSTLNCN